MVVRINPNRISESSINLADSGQMARAELRARLWPYDDIYYLKRRQMEYPPFLIRENHEDLDEPIEIQPIEEGIEYYDMNKRVRRQMKS